jgi:hypothetical protein
MGNLRSAIDELATLDPREMSPEAAADELLEDLRQRDRLDARIERLLGAVDRSGVWAEDGSISTRAWLRRHARITAGEASDRVRTARQLDAMPATTAAFAEGEIGYRHARVMALAVEASPACAETVADAEPILVEFAREHDPAALRRLVAHWQHRVDTDAFERGEQERFDRRSFHLSPLLDGMHALDGLLDAEGAAVLNTAINAFDRPLPDETRTPRQRRADALVEICRQMLDRRDLPLTGGERPHLNLELTLETLRQLPGAPAAHLGWGGPISAEAALRLACDCGLSRIITSGQRQPLDVGRRTPTIPAALRRAVIARDQVCQEPGCDRPWEWCDVHHIVHWSRGGETKLSNLELRCHIHHRDQHEGKRRDRRMARAP